MGNPSHEPFYEYRYFLIHRKVFFMAFYFNTLSHQIGTILETESLFMYSQNNFFVENEIIAQVKREIKSASTFNWMLIKAVIAIGFMVCLLNIFAQQNRSHQSNSVYEQTKLLSFITIIFFIPFSINQYFNPIQNETYLKKIARTTLAEILKNRSHQMTDNEYQLFFQKNPSNGNIEINEDMLNVLVREIKNNLKGFWESENHESPLRYIRKNLN